MEAGRPSSGPRWIFGLFLIAIGLYQTLKNLGFGEEVAHFGAYWPLIFVAMGILKFVHRDWTMAFFFSFLGLLFLWPVLWPEVSRFEFMREKWPLILVAIGVMMVIRSFETSGPKPKADDSPKINMVGVLSSPQKKVTSGEFQGGDLVAFMGGCELDLRGAQMAEQGAVLGLFAVWGAITIKVPRHWVVDLEAIPVMGGSEDKAGGESAVAGPRLVIQGLVVMGGVEVSS